MCVCIFFQLLQISNNNVNLCLQRPSDNNNIDHKYDENDVDSDDLVKCTSDKVNKLNKLTDATDDSVDDARKLSENSSSDLINNGQTVHSDNSCNATKSEEVSRHRAIEQAHDFILKIFSDQCDIQTNSIEVPSQHQNTDTDRCQLPKYDIAFQDMTSSTGTGTQMNTSTTTAKNSSNFHNNNNCSNNNNSNTKLDNILKRLTGKYLGLVCDTHSVCLSSQAVKLSNLI